jgi:hypothetical protein
MNQIKNILFLFITTMMFGCIKAFDPQIETNVENKYVVSGCVTDMEGWQEVEVSLSSPIESPSYIQVSGCQVNIQDNSGHDFPLEEFSPGKYHVWMGKESLTRGTSYRISILTPDGEDLVSGYDTMSKGPPLDSVYYALEDIPTPDPDITRRVMQFYVDLNAEGDYSMFYKWDVIETWEYHAAHRAENYYDGTWHVIDPPDETNLICYSNGLWKDVFTLSVKNLSQKKYTQYPLHYIDGSSSRLGILYSIMVRQFALSEASYNYWEKLRVNSNTQGGLYEKQPLAIKGNMLNLNHPEKKVLGYFYTASLSERRYFYHNVEGIELAFDDNCEEEGLGRGGWKEYGPNDYPVYYYFNKESVRILTLGCVDCRLNGGTTVKPDFWPL